VHLRSFPTVPFGSIVAQVSSGAVLQASIIANTQVLVVSGKETRGARWLTCKALGEIRQYEVADSPTWAHPVVLPDGFLIKDLKTLARWTAN
jgi:hypothetical protein